MKQVIRRGLKEIVVDEVPDPTVAPHHVLIRPQYSLISSGTETASIHQDGADYILSALTLRRDNILGGESRVYLPVGARRGKRTRARGVAGQLG